MLSRVFAGVHTRHKGGVDRFLQQSIECRAFESHRKGYLLAFLVPHPERYIIQRKLGLPKHT
jgi:hypothetical protein